MGNPVKASKLFLRKKADTKVTDGTAITDGLTANEDLFVNMPFKTSDLIDVNKRLSSLNVGAKSGDKIAAAALKTVNGEWVEKFGKTADAVSLIANGSKETILKAGMTPTSGESRKKQTPERAANLVATPGKGKGTCAVSVDSQAGVNGYVALATDASVAVTMKGDVIEMDVNGIKMFMKISSRRNMQLDGLPSKMELCVSMFTFNSAGSSPLSNSEEMVTQ